MHQTVALVVKLQFFTLTSSSFLISFKHIFQWINISNSYISLSQLSDTNNQLIFTLVMWQQYQLTTVPGGPYWGKKTKEDIVRMLKVILLINN